MVLERVCIKEFTYMKGYSFETIKFGEKFNCEVSVSEWGSFATKINGEEMFSYISVPDLNKVSVDLQDIRNLKLVLLTNDYTANKRLKKKIQTAHKMNDYHGILKHIAKAERFK